MKKIFLIFLTILINLNLYSYVRVSPTVLFINEPKRSTALEIFNPGAVEVEVWFELKYGYTSTDDSNRLVIVMPEKLSADDKSATEWLSTYPTKMVLKPNEKKIVRIMVSPPAGITDGEYWARVLVNSKQIGRKLKLKENPSGAKIGFDIQQQQSIPFHYRKGKLSTTFDLMGNPVIEVKDGKLHYKINMLRGGNSSYWGMLNFIITDKSGKMVKKEWQHMVVYKEIKRDFLVDVKDLTPGDYTLNVIAESKRYDDAAKYVIKTEPKSWKYNFRIQ